MKMKLYFQEPGNRESAEPRGQAVTFQGSPLVAYQSPPARPHLLKIPQPPKEASLSGEHMFQQEPVVDVSIQGHWGFCKPSMILSILLHADFLIPALR